MAGTITITLKNRVEHDSYRPGELSDTGLQITQNNIGDSSGVLLVTQATEVQLPVAGLTNRGILWLKNVDATNFVQWGFSTGVYGGRLNPAEPNQFRTLPAANLFMIADTADCEVQFRWLED